MLYEELVSGADVRECAWPRAAVVPDSAVFEIGRCQSFGRERGAEMSRMIEVIFRPPVASVDVYNERGRLAALLGGQSQIDKLV